MFSYGLFILALFTLFTFTGCNGTPTTPPENEEKLAINLNTPDVEVSIAGVEGNVTFLELARYYDKLKNTSLVDFGKINYFNMINCAKDIGFDSFLGWYTEDQARQSIIKRTLENCSGFCEKG